MVLCSPLLPCTSTPDAPPTKGAAWGCHMPQKGGLPKKGVEGGGSPPHACIRGATLARRNETSALKAGTRARTQPGPPTARRRPFVWSSAKYCPWPLSCQLPSLAKPLQLTHPAGFGGRGGGFRGTFFGGLSMGLRRPKKNHTRYSPIPGNCQPPTSVAPKPASRAVGRNQLGEYKEANF